MLLARSLLTLAFTTAATAVALPLVEAAGANSSVLYPAGRRLVAGTCKSADALGSCNECNATTNACATSEAPTGWFNCFTLAMIGCTDDRTTGPWFECRTDCKWWDWRCSACRWTCSGYDKVRAHRSPRKPVEARRVFCDGLDKACTPAAGQDTREIHARHACLINRHCCLEPVERLASLSLLPLACLPLAYISSAALTHPSLQLL
mmetsp:Transcript_36417/g.85070  ORF Transcript_36417/g.85070 Transcript_36417/m.85070 type:complete len:206 (-) Transcript_36417:23-640(-)